MLKSISKLGTELSKNEQAKINGGSLFPICGKTCFIRPDCTDANGCPIPGIPGCINLC